MPKMKAEQHWELLLDTAAPGDAAPAVLREGDQYPLQGRSLVVLRTAKPDVPEERPSPAFPGGVVPAIDKATLPRGPDEARKQARDDKLPPDRPLVL